MTELFVRAGLNDHTVIDNFLTPKSISLFDAKEATISTLVADASTVARRPQLAEHARNSGTPFVIDPLTPLMQSEQSPDDHWASLPFAHPEPLSLDDLSDYVLDELVDKTIEFQREHGATDLIPPYFYSSTPRDGWAHANLVLMRRTADYLQRNEIELPVIPVLALSLRGYAPGPSWEGGLDLHLDATGDLRVRHVALSWSWNNAARSNGAALALLLGATAHASDIADVIGWRGGAYGQALACVGASGYETGLGVGETLHYVSLSQSHKPRQKPQRGGGGGAHVYLAPFGRSVSRPTARALFAHRGLEGSLVCSPDNYCCAGGTDDMVTRWREHTIRERGRQLAEITAIPPQASWRLRHLEQWADRAYTLAKTANEVLEGSQVTTRIPTRTFADLKLLVEELLVRRRNTAA